MLIGAEEMIHCYQATQNPLKEPDYSLGDCPPGVPIAANPKYENDSFEKEAGVMLEAAARELKLGSKFRRHR